MKTIGVSSARHTVNPQEILAIILSLFLTPLNLDSYYSSHLECASSSLLISCNFFRARLKLCLLLSLASFIVLHYECPNPRNQQYSELKVLAGIWHSVTCISVTSLHILFWIFVLWFNSPYMNICSSQVVYKLSKDRARPMFGT